MTIVPATGSFEGCAWSESVGWICFEGADPAYNVITTFRPPPVGGYTELVSVLALFWPWVLLAALVATGASVAALLKRRAA